MFGSTITKYIIIVLTYLLFGVASYYYYIHTESRITEYIQTNTKQTIEIQLLNNTIEQMKKNVFDREIVLKQLSKDLSAAEEQKIDPCVPEDTVIPPEPPQTQINKTPKDYNPYIQKELGVSSEEELNKKYNDDSKCFQLITGADIKTLEKNKNAQNKLLDYCHLRNLP
jgi:uncharacterized coiled-coil protein SlyX